jgi:hypothetical protein
MEATYAVVWPLGEVAAEQVELGERTGVDLNGKVVAELCDMEMLIDWFPPVRAELERRYPDAKILSWDEFGLTHGPNEHEVIEALPAKLRENGVDLVISSLGT